MKTSSRNAFLVLALLGGCELENIEHDESSGGDTPADEDFPQQLAAAYCAALFACDPLATCGETAAPYASEADCVAGESQALAEVRTAARGAGLTYDPACVDATITRYGEIGCEGHPRLTALGGTLFSDCQPYVGDIPDGEGPCFEVVGSDLSECGVGLLCNESGGQCVPGEVTPCECGAGMWCPDPAVPSNGCVPIVGVGAACFVGTEQVGRCDDDSWCEVVPDDAGSTSGTCQPLVGLGASCHSAGQCYSMACDEVCIPAAPWLCDERAAPRHWR